MRFKSRNLRALAEIIIGDNKKFLYRSSIYITQFFEECDLDFVHDGSLDLKLLFKAVIAEPSAFAAWFARRHLIKTTLVIVLEGAWQAGERIPSIRELAAEPGVNPNTAVRSY